MPFEAYEKTKRHNGDCQYRNCIRGVPQFLLFCLCEIFLYIYFVLYHIAKAPYNIVRLLVFFGLLISRNCRSRKNEVIAERIVSMNQHNIDSPYNMEATDYDND